MHWCNNVPKLQSKELEWSKLNWPTNSFDTNPIENQCGKQIYKDEIIDINVINLGGYSSRSMHGHLSFLQPIYKSKWYNF